MSRKPLNTENEVDIFTHSASNDINTANNAIIKAANDIDNVLKMNQTLKNNNNNQKATKSPNVPPLKNANITRTNNSNQINNRNNNNKLSNSESFENSNGFTQNRSNTFGANTARIVKRELWWKEHPTEFKVPEPKPFRPIVAAPKVDNKMLNYSPPVSQRAIENRKLQWNSQPAVNTWENFHHQPGGGNKRYPVENVEWNALPKIDSGFIYTYEPNIENN